MALNSYWNELDLRERKIFERDIKNSLIEEYVGILSSFTDWENIQIAINEDYSQIENFANVKVSVSLKNETGDTSVTLKLIRTNRWKIYDLDYQTISIIGMEKMGYDSKIKRQGIEKLIQKMLKRS